MTINFNELQDAVAEKIFDALDSLKIDYESFLSCWSDTNADYIGEDQWEVCGEKFNNLHFGAEDIRGYAVYYLYMAFQHFGQSDTEVLPNAKLLELINAAHKTGLASGYAPDVKLVYALNAEKIRRDVSSVNGLKGAAEKHKNHAELKAWALKNAASMRDQDIDVARKLAAQIPSHLADVSKNPERLIYDALRARRTSK